MFWFMLLMNLLIPLTMVFVGIYFKKAALPEINPLFGYRTRRSMASLETWQFSNRLMGSYWFKYGLALSMARLGWFCPVVSEPVKPYFTRFCGFLLFVWKRQKSSFFEKMV